MKAIGYVRVSTTEQAREGVSVDNQIEKIKAYASFNGIEGLEIITDSGRSGKTLERPGMQEILSLCKSRQVSHVIVYKLDRLTRSTKDLLSLVEDVFQKNNVQFHSLTEKIDTSSAMGKFFLTIMGAMAQMEREQISERTKDALSYKKEKGERLGAPALGYRVENKEVIAIDEEAETFSYIIKLRGQGLTLQEIVDRLDAEGRRTKRGGKWYRKTVANILERAVA